VYVLNNNRYTVSAAANNAYFLNISTKNENIKARLLLLDLGNNTAMLSWQYDTIKLSNGNIFKRTTSYFSVNALKKDLKQISYALSLYGRDTQQLYSIKFSGNQSINYYTYLPKKLLLLIRIRMRLTK